MNLKDSLAMPPAESSQASMRWVVRQWLKDKPTGFEFTLAQASKALGLHRGGGLSGAIHAYLGHLIESRGKGKNRHEYFRVLPIANRTPEHLLPK